MRIAFLVLGGGAALGLIACLVAPGEPGGLGTSAGALACATTERSFNGACRTLCSATDECGAGTSCMKVGGDVSLCVEYKHCAYLGGDTTCSGAPHGYGYGYGAQSYSNSVSYAYGYGSSNGCTGNATWQVIAPGGDPSCGAPHAVTRCAPAAGGTCALVTGVTVDVADP